MAGVGGKGEWNKESSKIKKVKFFRDLDQIKLQRHGAERERISFVFERRDKHYAYLEDTEKTLNSELKNERIKLEQQLKRIKGRVTGFQVELKNVKPTPEFVKKLKETMEDIESTIADFKERQREIFENLSLAEKETEQEINILESKINALKDAPAEISSKQTKARMKPLQSDFPKEIQEFETFVAQHGGLQGGWDDYDHGAFLRIRDKFKGHKNFISAAARQIPGRSEEDINNHENWFIRFQELKQKKKEVITTWRMRKLQEEKENVQLSTSVETEEMKRKREEKEELLRKKSEQERKEKKEQLAAWKAQKKDEKIRAECKKIEQERLKQEIQEKQRREKEAKIKEVRAKLKERQEEEQRLQWMKDFEEEQFKKEQQQEIRANLSKFQERDRMALSLKHREQQRKQEKEIIRKERLEKTKEKVQVNRDRSRLYQLTEGWMHRKQDRQASNDSTNSALSRMPHRAIPAWRKNI